MKTIFYTLIIALCFTSQERLFGQHRTIISGTISEELKADSFILSFRANDWTPVVEMRKEVSFQGDFLFQLPTFKDAGRFEISFASEGSLKQIKYFLIEPGDSININWTRHGVVFSGKGFEKC